MLFKNVDNLVYKKKYFLINDLEKKINGGNSFVLLVENYWIIFIVIKI